LQCPQPSLRDSVAWLAQPSVETLDYCRLSLRDSVPCLRTSQARRPACLLGRLGLERGRDARAHRRDACATPGRWPVVPGLRNTNVMSLTQIRRKGFLVSDDAIFPEGPPGELRAPSQAFELMEPPAPRRGSVNDRLRGQGGTRR